MTFTEWISQRQDARTWSEDELAVAELTWNAAWHIVADKLKDLEKHIGWLEHHIHNLEKGDFK